MVLAQPIFMYSFHNDIPAALIEMGYLSNPAEALCLMNNAYQNLIADGILKAITSTFCALDDTSISR